LRRDHEVHARGGLGRSEPAWRTARAVTWSAEIVRIAHGGRSQDLMPWWHHQWRTPTGRCGLRDP
jgi:hypothetical protein